MKTLLEQLEPGAQNSLNSLDLCVSGSIAISLKRIADLMQRNQLPTYDGRLLVDTRF